MVIARMEGEAVLGALRERVRNIEITAPPAPAPQQLAARARDSAARGSSPRRKADFRGELLALAVEGRLAHQGDHPRHLIAVQRGELIGRRFETDERAGEAG